MRTYKVGDKVRISRTHPEGECKDEVCESMNEDMFKLRGKKAEITHITHIIKKRIEPFYSINIDVERWNWSPCMFEPLTRTIEDVEVGDVVVNDVKKNYEVVGVLKKMFACLNKDIYGEIIFWVTFKYAKELGWTIKDEMSVKNHKHSYKKISEEIIEQNTIDVMHEMFKIPYSELKKHEWGKEKTSVVKMKCNCGDIQELHDVVDGEFNKSL